MNGTTNSVLVFLLMNRHQQKYTKKVSSATSDVYKSKQFESIISSLLLDFQQSITDVLHKAQLQTGDIELVIRTGGSSLIPAVKTILERQVPGMVIEHDPFNSVAAGLAIAEYKGLAVKRT